MRILRGSALLILVIGVSASCATAQEESLKFDIGAVDKSADACQDFYQYACGGWLKGHPIPPDRSYADVYQEMYRINDNRVAEILKQGASLPSNAEQRKVGDYYASCMDEKSIEAKGLAALQTELGRIDGIKTPADFAREVARLHGFGADALFNMGADQRLEDAMQVIAYLDQSGLNLPEPGYYTSQDAEMQKARAGYEAHLEKIFALLGESNEQAKSSASQALKIETALAQAELKPVERRDRKAWYHLMSADLLETMAPDFGWKAYFAAIGFAPKGEVNVAVPKYMLAVEDLAKNTPMESWKSYLRWELVRAATPALPRVFREAEFDFYQHELGEVKEQRSREQQCTDLTNRDLGEAVGKEYAARYFPAPSKEKVLAMVERIKQAFREDIEQSTWMSAATKQEALKKLELLRAMIGYPDHWRDYSRLEIKRGDALGNALHGEEFEFHRQLAKISKPVDRGEFYELVQDVEGYHDNALNVIAFTAGILQPPFFDPQRDDAVNFGWAGAVMGHEMSHAFDDKGHQFDGEGDMRNWWTSEDAKKYDQRAACFVREYSEFQAVDDVKVNGQLTLGENIADNGGLQLAHMAFESQPHSEQAIDGYTPEQRFFLGWAQWRCMNITDARARELVRDDPHSPGRWRVNGVVSNMPAFAKAYGCKAGDKMVRDEPCRVW